MDRERTTGRQEHHAQAMRADGANPDGIVVCTPFELGAAVAATVLDPHDAPALAAMELWHVVVSARATAEPTTMHGAPWASGSHAPCCGDRGLCAEYAFARPLLGQRSPFSASCRRALWRNMLEPRAYCGDEYAVRTLERLLHVRLLIIKRQARSDAPPHGEGARTVAGRADRRGASATVGQVEHAQDGARDDGQAPRWHMVLVLDRAHYMPLLALHDGDPRATYDAQGPHATQRAVGTFAPHQVPHFVAACYAQRHTHVQARTAA